MNWGKLALSGIERGESGLECLRVGLLLVFSL